MTELAMIRVSVIHQPGAAFVLHRTLATRVRKSTVRIMIAVWSALERVPAITAPVCAPATTTPMGRISDRLAT